MAPAVWVIVVLEPMRWVMLLAVCVTSESLPT